MLFLLLLLWGIFVYGTCIYMVTYLGLIGPIKWLFGYSAGQYIAYPNYGLIIKSTIPDSELAKDRIITWTPQITFLVLILTRELSLVGL